MIRPLFLRQHREAPDRLREQEDAADVGVHHLVPALDGVLLGRLGPGCAGVVDEDVDVAESLVWPASARRAASASLLVSAAIRSASMPRLLRWVTAASRSAALRELTMTRAPHSPSASAICRPRPREPPVTSAVLPLEVEEFLDVKRAMSEVLDEDEVSGGGPAQWTKSVTLTQRPPWIWAIRAWLLPSRFFGPNEISGVPRNVRGNVEPLERLHERICGCQVRASLLGGLDEHVHQEPAEHARQVRVDVEARLVRRPSSRSGRLAVLGVVAIRAPGSR